MRPPWIRMLLALAFLGALAACDDGGQNERPVPSGRTTRATPATEDTPTTEDAPATQGTRVPATTRPAPLEEPEPEPVAAPRSAVPKKLTGVWSGGSAGDATSGVRYRFDADGDVVHAFYSATRQGTVVVDGSTMTFYFGAEVIPMRWDFQDCADPSGYGYPFKTLFLDGLSYVQDC